MRVEIEAKFLGTDLDTMRTRLQDAGAVCVCPMRTMKRKHFDFPDKSLQAKNAFVRLRDEGGRVTLCYKQLENRTVYGTKEANTVVKDFAATEQFLHSLGMQQKSYHETRRESWKLDDTEIELDEWPWLPPIIELETKDEKTLWDVAKVLRLDVGKALHGTVDLVYAMHYDVTEDEVNNWSEITFTPVPEWLKDKEKQT